MARSFKQLRDERLIFALFLSILTSGVNLELDARDSAAQLTLRLIAATRKTKLHSVPWTRN